MLSVWLQRTRLGWQIRFVYSAMWSTNCKIESCSNSTWHLRTSLPNEHRDGYFISQFGFNFSPTIQITQLGFQKRFRVCSYLLFSNHYLHQGKHLPCQSIREQYDRRTSGRLLEVNIFRMSNAPIVTIMFVYISDA